MTTPDEVLSYWFGPIDAPTYPASRPEVWFGAAAEVDADIRLRFGETYALAERGELTGWASAPRGVLAHVLVIDQLSRNMFRDTPRMYALDDDAQALVLQALLDGVPARLLPVERTFLYMPLMHAESRAMQRLCVRLFEAELAGARPADRAGFARNVDFARKHALIVERFGRFPHRNGLLGRASSPDEQAFLDAEGRGF